MADSIGQLVVEVALDAKQMYSDLEKTERKLSDTQVNIVKSEKKQTDAQRELKSQIDKTTQSRREETTTVKSETEATKLNTDAVGQQTSGWGNLSDKVASAKSEFDQLEKPIKNVSKILGPLTSLLGMFGVTIGIQAVITAFKDMAENAKNAREEYSKISEAIGYHTGMLDQVQMQRVNRIANVETGTGYDLTETEKAVGRVDKLYSDLAVNERDNLIKTFLGVAEVTGQSVETIISDISKIANQYKIPVTEVSAMTDNIRVLAQASGASVQDITSIMTQYKSVFDTVGVTNTSDIANAIAGMIQQTRGDVDAVAQQLADYQLQYQSKYTEILNNLIAGEQEKDLDEQMSTSEIEQQATTAAKQWASSFATELRPAITDLGMETIVPLDVLLPGVRSAETQQKLTEQSKQIAEWAKNTNVNNAMWDAMTTTTSDNAVLQAWDDLSGKIGDGVINTTDFSAAMTNGSAIINGTYIPSASALTTSLYGVADAYNAVADARDRAGM